MQISKSLLKNIAVGLSIGIVSSCSVESHSCDKSCKEPCKKPKKEIKFFGSDEEGCPACGMG